jgi:hypothetical protein
VKRPLYLAAGIAAIGIAAAPATVASASGPPLYNSAMAPASVGNLPSVGPEAYAFSEFGNQVTLTDTHIGKVTVMLSTWGCQTGHWNTGNCSTAPGTKFPATITFNIYNAPTDGVHPGSLIASLTKPFNIPYRPSANYTHCNGANAGKWWDGPMATCFNGKAVDITFGFGRLNLPSTNVVFGIAYNTTHYGYNPIGESAPCFNSAGGCGYDSLNIALSQDPTNLTAGSDPNFGTVFQNSSIGGEYCDGGAAGTGSFRLDSPASPSCWGAGNDPTLPPYYIPAVLLAHS